MTDTPRLLAVGRIRKPHGIRGEVVVETMTDAPDATFAPGRRVFVGTVVGDEWHDAHTGATRTLTVTKSRPFQDGLLVIFDAITDRSLAEHWRNHTLLVPVSELELPDDGEVYEHELEGLAVVNTKGELLGAVTAWYRLPQGLLLDVNTARGIVSVPFSEKFVVRVDRATRTITVDIPEEFFERGA